MNEIIIIGAGAIGRGFLPWMFSDKDYEFIFVDANADLVERFKTQQQYRTYRVAGDRLEERIVPVKKAYHISEFSMDKHPRAKAVFMNVGPRNCFSAANSLKGVRCPVILCENDPQTVTIVKNALDYEAVFFAIPDVITSNTASSENLGKDPLSVHTEDGILFVHEGAKGFGGNITFCNEEELNKQWTAKLYLHNTPHCIAAYLGALVGAQYVHEAMAFPELDEIVRGAMSEMLTALKLRWEIPHTFLEWYADKEIQRFSNVLLCDPISRVAREPLRKLELEGRLIGAAQICLSLGFIPQNILTGITGALLFENDSDMDRHLAFMRKVLPARILLTYLIALRKGEALERVMTESFENIVERIEMIVQKLKRTSNDT